LTESISHISLQAAKGNLQLRNHKAHRPARSGSKAEKMDMAKGGDKQRDFNEKAGSPFEVLAFSSTKLSRHLRRSDRQGRRNVERDQTRLHVPLAGTLVGMSATSPAR